MTLVSIPANPVPANAFAGMLRTRDGVHLRFARFAPPPGNKGTVCIFPGRSEFIEKYFETVADLQKRGFAVAILDWRGQGLSDRALRNRAKGHVKRFSAFDTDLKAFMAEIVLPDCPPPFFALGHSMAGAIVLRALVRGERWFDRVVLSAPMIALHGLGAKAVTRWTIRTMRWAGFGTRFVPGGSDAIIGTAPFAGNILTSDPVRYARNAAILKADPLLGIGSPTVTWTDSAMRAMAALAEPSLPGRIRQPLLLIGAGRDQVVSTPAIEEFGVRLRNGSHLVIPGAQHELLMEQDQFRGQFWAAFDAFVPGTPVF